LKAVPNAAAYAVSKAGVISLTKTVAAEEGKRGIRVNCIAPYVLSRPFFHHHLPVNHPSC
jgi:meso-butanediol dehydrogenase/(S,S)-butanediol dehydrogenase/diacetyl reductase